MNRGRARNELKEVFNVEELGSKVDLLIYLDFVIFINKLAEESEKAALKRNQFAIKKQDVESCVENVLREFRG